MTTCVIFNPAARGEKARRFRAHLDKAAGGCVVKPTSAAGHGRALARAAIDEGFTTLIAAGGDGTVNEVLNGMGDHPRGFEAARLAVLPLGTVNVFARELRIPMALGDAWQLATGSAERVIDLPLAEYFGSDGVTTRRYFAQLGGAGLDALAVELVQWRLKKRIGPLAYVLAGLQALRRPAADIQVSVDGKLVVGQLVLVGNGKFYGGNYNIFPKAELTDGILEARVFPKVNWATLARCGPQLLLRGTLPDATAVSVRGHRIEVASRQRTPVELDGEWVGCLPAVFTVERRKLRVAARI